MRKWGKSYKTCLAKWPTIKLANFISFSLISIDILIWFTVFWIRQETNSFEKLPIDKIANKQRQKKKMFRDFVRKCFFCVFMVVVINQRTNYDEISFRYRQQWRFGAKQMKQIRKKRQKIFYGKWGSCQTLANNIWATTFFFALSSELLTNSLKLIVTTCGTWAVRCESRSGVGTAKKREKRKRFFPSYSSLAFVGCLRCCFLMVSLAMFSLPPKRNESIEFCNTKSIALNRSNGESREAKFHTKPTETK